MLILIKLFQEYIKNILIWNQIERKINKKLATTDTEITEKVIKGIEEKK